MNPSPTPTKGQSQKTLVITFLLAAVSISGICYMFLNNRSERKQNTAQPQTAHKQEATTPLKNGQPDAKVSKPSINAPSPKVENGRESLARLKSQLASGNRGEMPVGTVIKGKRARFLIDTPMSWPEAQQFCLDHGGYLAVLPTATDLWWLSSQLKPDQTVWLGAGTSGNKNWLWIDNTPWKQKIRGTRNAAYAVTDDTGVLAPHPPTEKHSFYIEWMMDASNNTSLEKQLKRCAASLSTNTPFFPAGTTSHGGHHYFLVYQATDWKTANQLANLAGGTLAVPSRPDENVWMLDFIASSLNENQTCWIGGIRIPNETWKWVTDEPWNLTNWSPGKPDGDETIAHGCAISPSRSWKDFPLSSTQTCFLIEWDNIPKNARIATNRSQGAILKKNKKATKVNVTQIRQKYATLARSLQTRYAKLFASNAQGYVQELRVFKRGLTKSQKEIYNNGIFKMGSGITNNRIPNNVPISGMPEKAVNILHTRLDKQRRLDGEFSNEIGKLKARYLKYLNSLLQTSKDKSLMINDDKIRQEIKNTSNQNHDFLTYILSQ